MYSKALEIWDASYARVLDALYYADSLRLLTPDRAYALVILASALFAAPIVWVAMKHLARRRSVALMSMAIPLFVAAMLQGSGGFHGTPDDNCAKYGGGMLEFTLIELSVVPKRPTEIYGEEWLLLLVRAPDRWGDEPHQCRLSMADENARKLREAVREVAADFFGGGYTTRGTVRFTFGSISKGAGPNVRFFRTTPSPGKPGPPEVPRSKQRDT